MLANRQSRSGKNNIQENNTFNEFSSMRWNEFHCKVVNIEIPYGTEAAVHPNISFQFLYENTLIIIKGGL